MELLSTDKLRTTIIAAEAGDQHAFSLLYNKFFPIVFWHLVKNFPKVRVKTLEDAAMESVEYWFENLDSEDKYFGYKLCKKASQTISKIIRPRKYKPIAFSNLSPNEEVDDYFINQTIYKIISEGYDSDIAKISFQLKKKADRYIGELPDESYKIISLFLGGVSRKNIVTELKIPPGSLSDKFKKAFSELKRLIYNEKKSIHNTQPGYDTHRLSYLANRKKCKYKKIMDLYYVDQFPMAEIAKKLKVSYATIKTRVKGDRRRMNAA